ncbi:hypothetical protein LY76DRAFT_662273, partial [Colletotrichum caudatum]
GGPGKSVVQDGHRRLGSVWNGNWIFPVTPSARTAGPGTASPQGGTWCVYTHYSVRRASDVWMPCSSLSHHTCSVHGGFTMRASASLKHRSAGARMVQPAMAKSQATDAACDRPHYVLVSTVSQFPTTKPPLVGHGWPGPAASLVLFPSIIGPSEAAVHRASMKVGWWSIGSALQVLPG